MFTFQMWHSLSLCAIKYLEMWACRESPLPASFDGTFSRWMFIEHQLCGRPFTDPLKPLELGVCGGPMAERPQDCACRRAQRGPLSEAVHEGTKARRQRGQRSEEVHCPWPPSSKEAELPAGVDASEWSLSAPLSQPPEEQDLEQFRVQHQPSDSTAGNSREKKNKNQCEPSLWV